MRTLKIFSFMVRVDYLALSRREMILTVPFEVGALPNLPEFAQFVRVVALTWSACLTICRLALLNLCM